MMQRLATRALKRSATTTLQRRNYALGQNLSASEHVTLRATDGQPHAMSDLFANKKVRPSESVVVVWIQSQIGSIDL
jgi:hypothetical protein